MSEERMDIILGAINDFSDEFSQFQESMKKSKKGSEGLGKAFTKLDKIIKGTIVGALAGMGLAVVKSIKDVVSLNAELDKLGAQLGIGGDEMATWGFISQQTGIELEDIAGGLEELRLRIAEAAKYGTGPAIDAFEKLGLSADELMAMPIEQSVGIISDKLNELDANTRQFMSDEIFGGDGRRLQKVFDLGSEGIEGMSQKAQEMGLVMDDTAKAGQMAFRDVFKDLQTAMTANASWFMNEYGQAILEISSYFQLWIEDFGTMWDTMVGAFIVKPFARLFKWLNDALGEWGWEFGGQVADAIIEDVDRKVSGMNKKLNEKINENLQKQREQAARGTGTISDAPVEEEKTRKKWEPDFAREIWKSFNENLDKKQKENDPGKGMVGALSGAGGDRFLQTGSSVKSAPEERTAKASEEISKKTKEVAAGIGVMADVLKQAVGVGVSETSALTVTMPENVLALLGGGSDEGV